MSTESFSFVLAIGLLFYYVSQTECLPAPPSPREKPQAARIRTSPDQNVLRFTASSSREDVINELARRIRDSQVQKDRAYRFPLTWQQDKGMYPSDIKLNLAGEPQLAFVRDTVSVFDNNMFATAWVTICLLETQLYAKTSEAGPRPSESQLSLAVEAIGRYHDKNRGFSNSLMNFWPQAFNSSTGVWVSTPTNMLKAFQVFDVIPVKLLEDLLKALGMSDVEHFLETILSMRSIFESAFHIPPDFDDTFVNLGLGALLKDVGQDFPQVLQQWASRNTNVTSVLDAVRKYAYRPFSRNLDNVNTIDVRTYYYLRHFLEEARAKGEDIALVPTWVQDLDEARKDYFKDVVMPYNINNVDVTVSANAVYGLTASVLSGIFPESVLDDPLVKQVYVNTSSMIAWQISHQLYQRPDLELAYYPSVFEFYWFVARTFSKLETAALRKTPLPPAVDLLPAQMYFREYYFGGSHSVMLHPIFCADRMRQMALGAMQEVYSVLKSALEQSMSSDVVSKARPMEQDMLYFDDFLGDGDVDLHNKTVVRGEDRLFTTSMAVNALLYTWTLFEDVTGTLHWKDDTPQEVRTTVEKSVRFLETYIMKDTYKPWNTFFSGSSKGSSSMPFGYPANRIEYLNGTAIHDDQHFPKGGPFLFGVQGSIPEAQYQALIKEKHFGMHTPTTFTSYNENGSYFPFWTSSAYTYATAMLGLARFDSIVP